MLPVICGRVSQEHYPLGTFEGMSIDEWGRFLHEREGIEEVRVNGSAIWSARVSAVDDALAALEAVRDDLGDS